MQKPWKGGRGTHFITIWRLGHKRQPQQSTLSLVRRGKGPGRGEALPPPQCQLLETGASCTPGSCSLTAFYEAPASSVVAVVFESSVNQFCVFFLKGMKTELPIFPSVHQEHCHRASKKMLDICRKSDIKKSTYNQLYRHGPGCLHFLVFP